MNRLFVWIAAALACGAIITGSAASGQGRPMATPPHVTAPKDHGLAKLKAAAVRADKLLKAKPTNAKLKASAAEAHFQLGHATMVAQALPPRVKYREALRQFRVVLSLNPAHRQARDEKILIETIYKQMGRPIPM